MSAYGPHPRDNFDFLFPIGFGGQLKVAAGTIARPAPFIDIPTVQYGPYGHGLQSVFHLDLTGLRADTGGRIAMALSADGGETFVNDATHADSYTISDTVRSENYNPSFVNPRNAATFDGLQLLDDQDSVDACLRIGVGSNSDWVIVVEGFTTKSGRAGVFSCKINPNATIPPSLSQTYNLLRIAAPGTIDFSNPMGNVFTAGHWRLRV